MPPPNISDNGYSSQREKMIDQSIVHPVDWIETMMKKTIYILASLILLGLFIAGLTFGQETGVEEAGPVVFPDRAFGYMGIHIGMNREQVLTAAEANDLMTVPKNRDVDFFPIEEREIITLSIKPEIPFIYLQFFDEKGQLLELHKNPFWKQPRRAGISCVDFLAEKKATVFVARIVGNKMEGALDGQQITFMAFEGTVKEAVAFVLTNRKKMGTGK